MNCSQAERRIYLYAELALHEREETDRHLLTCASCRQAMDRVKNAHAILRSISQTRPGMPDKDVVVSRVMRAVQERQQKKPAVFHTFLPNPVANPLRYVMAAISVFLLIAFVSEYNTSVETPSSNVSRGVKTTDKVELNSASFHSILIASKERNKSHPTSLYDCVMRCLRTNDADCTDCRVKIPQLN